MVLQSVLSELELGVLFAHNPAPMVIYRIDTLRLCAANAAFCALYGYERSEIDGLPASDLFIAEERDNAAALARSLEGAVRVGEWRHLSKLGATLNVMTHSQPVLYQGLACRLTIVTDITALRRSQQRDRSRVALMESLAMGASQAALLTQLVLAHEALFPDSLCSILLLDASGQHLTGGAAPHLPDFYNAAIEGLAIGPTVGSCGAAAATGQRVIVADIASHPNWIPFRELAARAGLAACWSEPIIGPQGRVLGSFAIYRRSPGTPSEEELEHQAFSVQLAATAIMQGDTTDQLRRSEQRLRSILGALPDLVWLKDAQGRYMACNAAFERWVDRSEAELRGVTEQAFGDEAEAERVRRSDALVIETRRPQPDERWLQGARAEQRALYDIVKTPLLNEQGEPVGIVGVARDITEIRRREARIHRLNRSYALLSGVNEAIVRLRDTGQLFAEVCRIAVQVGGFRMAWIGRLDEACQLVVPCSHAGHVDGYLDTLRIPLETSAGPTARAMRSGQPMLANDIAGDPLMAFWRDAALARGYRSSAAFPISSGGQIQHALMVYSVDVGHFDAEQVELMLRLAQDIGLALAVDAAEAGQRKEQSFNKQLIESVAGAFFVLDAQGQLRQWNRRLEEMSGYDSATIAGKRAPDFFSDAEKPLIRRRLADAFAQGEASVEASLLRQDGGRTPCLFVVRRLEGSQPLMVGTGIDISDRVRSAQELDRYRIHLEELVATRTAELEAANARLSREDQRLRAMLALSQQASQLGEQQLLETAIEEIARLSGSPVAALHLLEQAGEGAALRTVAGAWTRGTPATIQTMAERVAAPGSPARLWELAAERGCAVKLQSAHSNDVAIACPPGVERALALPVLGQGRLRLVLCVANKPSPYDDADERELLQLAGDLWSIVERRRIELDLHEAKLAADAANQAKSAFLANMSHEIRTPMNAVLGFAHLLRREPLSAAQQEHLNKIADASQHLLQVINDILDFSKIEAHKISLEPIDFELRACVERVRAMLADRAEAKRIALRLELAPSCPALVHGDRLRLEQILLNLLSNAVKFTEQGEVRLTVQPLDGARLRFLVDDSGIGMSPRQMEHLFEAFQQADASITRRFGGTGLGLAISRRLAQLMHGDIGVRSEPGRGSSFWLDLPLPAALGRGTVAASGGPASQSQRLRPARVLLAEDNPINQEVAMALLEELQVAVDVADDGAMALRMAQQGTYDLVLMDVQMPEMDGLQATRAMRQIPALAGLPIVAMTANAFAEDRAQCLAAGMSDYLAKPVDPAALKQCLLRWLPGEAESDASVAGELAPIDWAALQRLLDRLQPLLISYDTAAADLVEQEQAALVQALGERGQQFVRLVLDFSFAEAEDALVELQRAMRQSHPTHAQAHSTEAG
ncbi:GAF domain-containing protein [Paucibacter sp. APW11]|uniref:histidine kinase n=1 Tax=Roseateles aquae TaxID=3077235 RepID=A0ABU3PJJ8_9BURK|nr:GAF domain-containing protein [Paucibacter sp. APW11]MDT9002308.1 GAF domain-containing protein [Paucibacter sp. APW11]